MKMSYLNLPIKKAINIKIVGLIAFLILGSFTQQMFWPFIPYDMYCKERAEFKKSFWLKIIDNNNKQFYVSAVKGYPVSKRFFYKSNLLTLQKLKKEHPEKVQFFLNKLSATIAKRRKMTIIRLELYEQTHFYQDEKFLKETVELIGAAK